MDRLDLYKRVIENFKSMTLKEALKKEHVGTKVFMSLIEEFPEETQIYNVIKKQKRSKERPLARKVFSKKVLNNVIAMYEQGETLKTIAKKFSTSATVIKRNLFEAGFSLRTQEELNLMQGNKKCPIKTDEKWREVFETYLKERSLYRACELFNTTPQVAIRNFKRLKLPFVKLEQDIKYKTKQGIRSLYNDDWSDLFTYYEKHSINEVSEFFDISPRRIYRIFKKLGYTRRSCSEERDFTKDKRGEQSFEKLKESLKEYTILEEFKGYTRHGKYLKYTFRHDKCGRTFQRTLHDPLSIRCTHCYPKSRGENFIKEELKTLGITFIGGDRTVIAPQELDFYIPSKQIAIEYNGRYWHNECVVSKNYHKDKTNKCLLNGVKLYHFWEGQNNEIIESRIKQMLGSSSHIFARKTSVALVDIKERKNFFNSTHLSGDTACLFAIGLFQNDELISCMSFRRHKEGIEIARFSSKLGFIIVGGFSKLLKFATSYIKDNFQGIDKIISYCNRDWTAQYTDSVYFKNGFQFVKDTGPILSYYNQNTGCTESREKYQKHKLKKLFPEYNGENVNEFLRNRGILRMYNSGNWKFEKEIK